MDYCNACRKPFDEVHPLDHMNDLMICRDMNEHYIGVAPNQRPSNVCFKNHTWREHVAESFNYQWFNPHFRVAVLKE